MMPSALSLQSGRVGRWQHSINRKGTRLLSTFTVYDVADHRLRSRHGGSEFCTIREAIRVPGVPFIASPQGGDEPESEPQMLYQVMRLLARDLMLTQAERQRFQEALTESGSAEIAWPFGPKFSSSVLCSEGAASTR
jgi:hypothetical protein